MTTPTTTTAPAGAGTPSEGHGSHYMTTGNVPHIVSDYPTRVVHSERAHEVITDAAADDAAAIVLHHALATTGALAVLEALDGLNAGDFHRDTDRIIWATMCELRDTAAPYDFASVMAAVAPDAKARMVSIHCAPHGNVDTAVYHAATVMAGAKQRAARAAVTAAAARIAAGGNPLDAVALVATEADPSWTPKTAFEAEVERKAHSLRVAEAARLVVQREAYLGDDELDMSPLDYADAKAPGDMFRIDGLMTTGACLLITAQKKAGKTTHAMALARHLLTGGKYLGRFDVHPVAPDEAVGYVNAELEKWMFTDWMKRIGAPEGRVVGVHTRGKRTDILGDTRKRRQVAQYMRDHNVKVLIVDPFTAVCGGIDENSTSDVRPWLDDLATFAKTECGASELILCHHAGHGTPGAPVRARGASAFGDWYDQEIVLTNPEGLISSPRYFRAGGRGGVDVTEDRIEIDLTTMDMHLTGTGGHKQQTTENRHGAKKSAVESYVYRNPGLSVSAIAAGLRDERKASTENGETPRPAVKREELPALLDELARDGLVEVRGGDTPGTAKQVFPTDRATLLR